MDYNELEKYISEQGFYPETPLLRKEFKGYILTDKSSINSGTQPKDYGLLWTKNANLDAQENSWIIQYQSLKDKAKINDLAEKLHKKYPITIRTMFSETLKRDLKNCYIVEEEIPATYEEMSKEIRNPNLKPFLDFLNPKNDWLKDIGSN